MSASGNALAGCTAIACCPPGPPLRSLENLAAATGFGRLIHYGDMAALREQGAKVLFFLVHYGLGDEWKAQFLALLRTYPSPQIQLAPVILIAQDCSAEVFLGYVEMGFDDILCLPDSATLLVDRLMSQLNRDILYVETTGYFGPDRRRMELVDGDHPRRVSTVHKHTKLTINRTVANGPQIVRKQDFWHHGNR